MNHWHAKEPKTSCFSHSNVFFSSVFVSVFSDDVSLSSAFKVVDGQPRLQIPKSIGSDETGRYYKNLSHILLMIFLDNVSVSYLMLL